MAKLRHIALSVPDPERAAKFFEQAFGMTRAGNAMRGVYMTDGIMNVALLNSATSRSPVSRTRRGTAVSSISECGWIAWMTPTPR